jgi:hypothetical protein
LQPMKGDDMSQTKQFNFGVALEHIKCGLAVARSGWNGKGMFVYLDLGMARPEKVLPSLVSDMELISNELRRW